MCFGVEELEDGTRHWSTVSLADVNGQEPTATHDDILGENGGGWFNLVAACTDDPGLRGWPSAAACSD